MTQSRHGFGRAHGRRSVKRRAEQFAENITDSLVEHVGKDHGVKFDIALTLPRRGIDY